MPDRRRGNGVPQKCQRRREWKVPTDTIVDAQRSAAIYSFSRANRTHTYVPSSMRANVRLVADKTANFHSEFRLTLNERAHFSRITISRSTDFKNIMCFISRARKSA